jgi:hypothetical protein
MARATQPQRTLVERLAYHVGLGPLVIVLHAQASTMRRQAATPDHVPANRPARAGSPRSAPPRTARLA